MKSEFRHIELDRVRYSLVWEDSMTLYEVLDINRKDHLLVITSAGCNVLNALLKNPGRLTAIDLNPFQNKLLLLKKHIILYHDYEVFYDLLGFAGKIAVKNAAKKLMKTLLPDEQVFWTNYLKEHPGGLLSSGKLESYITGFYKTLSKDIRQKLQRLISFNRVEEQYRYFINHIDNSSFKDDFIAYYSDDNLSRGRDPKLLKYAREPLGSTFYKRLHLQAKSALLKHNFHFRFFFFGLKHLPDEILPPCYRQENYSALRQQLYKIHIAEGEAMELLLSGQGTSITKAALSNIFEYISREEFHHINNALIRNPKRQLRMVFWNLLNGQAEDTEDVEDRMAVTVQPLSPEASFYFKNVVSIQFSPQPAHVHIKHS